MVDGHFDARLVARFSRHSWEEGQDINPVGRIPKLDDSIFLKEVTRTQPETAEPKCV